MTSILRPASPQKSNVISPKQKFRTVQTVFGFRPLYSRDSSDTDAQATNPTFSRNSIDTASYSAKRKSREGRLSVSNIAFFEQYSNTNKTSTSHKPSIPIVDLTGEDMKTLDAAFNNQARRAPVRMDNHDGPWSVSVAETPHDSSSYSLYIKTPTHNLTLTRTAMEIVELDHKLRDSYPSFKIPDLPINVDTLPIPPPKRKSNFLNTLSRLASPSSAKSNRQTSTSRRAGNSSSIPSTLPTPLTSPSGEFSDPFLSFAPSMQSSAIVTAPSASSTGIAAYLTTVSNTMALRQDRVWKRFVRVGTDDLESVRVERAIKRVRSDLAAHVGLSREEKENGHRMSVANDASAAASDAGSLFEEKSSGVDEKVVRHKPSEVIVLPKENETKKEGNEPASEQVPGGDGDVSIRPAVLESVENVVEEPASMSDADAPAPDQIPLPDEGPVTPVISDPHRLHRSQSADPDKSSRISRAYVSSVPSQNGASSATGDESSAVSTTNGSRRASGRKKRSMSSAPKEPKKSQRKVIIDDFEMMRVLGKGCAGKVLLVKHKTTSDLFALKAITKRHVLAHQELQHTLTEQAVLKRMAAESRDPFVVKLWWSFHDKENLFLVMDFHPGGDLATQLARWGRLGRDRARFYAAEIVEGVEGLHAAGVIYRDLKPENILIGADGHIVLTDFGLSKEFPRRSTASSSPVTPSGSRGGEFYSSVPGSPQPVTPPWMKAEKGGELALGWPGQPVGHSDSTTTFCGTAEYLAPEVIQGLPYSYEVDWWSFGTMLYEMLTGITPFWANNHSDMYVRVLQDELQFPDDRAIDQDTKSLIRGLLQRNPGLRICEPRIKRHPYFSMIDWSHVYYKRYIPPYIPPIDPSNASDTQNFDDTFLDMEPVLDDFNDDQGMDTDQEPQTDIDRTDGEESNTTPSQSRSSSIRPLQRQKSADNETVDVFDGYSFKGRHSVYIDDEPEDEDAGSDEESIGEDDNLSILKELEPQLTRVESIIEEDIVEPKTPEARPAALPEPEVQMVAPSLPAVETIAEPIVTNEITEEPEPDRPIVVDETLQKSIELPPSAPVPAAITNKDSVIATPPPKNRLPANRKPTRREKSGVPALDKYLSDGADVEATEAERDDEDDDWDFIEAADGEDRNGAKGPSLFARGVVDRYRLAVFRKASTPSQRAGPRSFSGMSKNSETTVSESADSPSPSQRRGRNPGLTFRKHPRQFLRPKSPPSSYSSKSSMTAKSVSQSTSNNLSAMSMSSGLLTPSPSVGSMPMTPSLKSKESAISVGTQSQSSDQSGNGGLPAGADDAGHVDTSKGSPPQPEEPEKQKNKKLKKYKENAEKVFSLFSSPRQAP